MRQVSTNRHVQIVSPSDGQYAGLTFRAMATSSHYVVAEKTVLRRISIKFPGWAETYAD